ncbi:RIC1-domain-containing protein [Trametopsis cervina]|nr:RIC1-domain-containing protein [Trametopsis cervina]
MYFPTSVARQLSSAPPLPQPHEQVISLAASPRKTLFGTLTKDSVSVWRQRPSAVLAHLTRTPASIEEHGLNVSMEWSPDGSKIVIQTTLSYLVLVTVDMNAEETVYRTPPLPPASQRHFLPGPGEGMPLPSLSLHLEGVIRIEGSLVCVSPRRDYILFSTKSPPSVQRIPWPSAQDGDDYGHGPYRANENMYDTWLIQEDLFPWLLDSNVTVDRILYSRTTGTETWLTSDGRAYLVQLYENNGHERSSEGIAHSATENVNLEHEHHMSPSDSQALGPLWHGTCIHNVEPPKWVQKRRLVRPDDPDADQYHYDEPRRAIAVSINAKFSLAAIGMHGGAVELVNLPSLGILPPAQVLQIPQLYNKNTGPVNTMEWSSDGHVLAVGWKNGWAVWSVGGRCLAWGFGTEYEVDETRFTDAFMYGIRDLFWGPGNFELVVLADSAPNSPDGELFIIPFAKSANTAQHSPDNTQYAFLQMDDRVLVYRGADQPDMSVINPESDVWQRIKIPQDYLATNWPIRYSALSTDGRLIAIAGRRGLCHYSSNSGRWKMFEDELQEQAFTVRGGLLWFHHVLVVAVELSKTYQIRLYSRDLELSNQQVLHREVLTSPVVILSLVDNSLLVYTADNILHHYLIVPTDDSIKLHACGSISFDGVITAPNAVRVLSWMIPAAQKQLGDPTDDLAVATVLMIVGGNLVLLRPNKTGDQEVKYDMQLLSDRIEFCWIHLRGIGALENSLWGYDGQNIRVWLNALAIESPEPSVESQPEHVKESVSIPLDFYPLSVLMDKGIIIGVEHEAASRMNLPFIMFRHVTSTHLFLQHVLRVHLENGQLSEAVSFAYHYQHLVFFAHALEVLLHGVIEDDLPSVREDGSHEAELERKQKTLTNTVDFLDYFDAALDVVVNCARKIEVTNWPRLFDVVGNPKTLFEVCLASGRLKTAGSYLLVLHTLEQLDGEHDDAIRLLRCAIEAKEWQLCRELLRFLRSIDDSGEALRLAVHETGLLDTGNGHAAVSGTSQS